MNRAVIERVLQSLIPQPDPSVLQDLSDWLTAVENAPIKVFASMVDKIAEQPELTPSGLTAGLLLGIAIAECQDDPAFLEALGFGDVIQQVNRILKDSRKEIENG